MGKRNLRKVALLFAPLSSFVSPFMGSSINIALPAIEKDLQMDAVLLSWVQTAFLLACAVVLVPFGRLSDIYGRKKVYLSGMVIFTLSSCMAGLSTSPAMLLAARALQGMGSALVVANTVAILTSLFPPEKTGKVLGINVAAVYTGLTLGPLLGGILTHYLSWRSIFLVTVPVSLVPTVLVVWKLKGEWADAKGEKFDFGGSAIYALSIVTFMYGVTVLPGARSLFMIVAGLVGIVLFVIWEKRLHRPLFEIRLFRENRLFALSNLAALLSYSTTFAVPFLLSLYLQHIKGFDPPAAGMILVAQPLVMATMSPFAGRFSDKIEPRIVTTFGLMLIVTGVFIFSFIDKTTPLSSIVGTLILVGSGIAFFSSPNVNAVMGSVEKRSYGLAAASAGTMRLLGQTFSMGIATLLFSLFIGRVQITAEHHQIFMISIKTAFTIFTMISLTAVFVSLLRGKLRKKHQRGPG